LETTISDIYLSFNCNKSLGLQIQPERIDWQSAKTEFTVMISNRHLSKDEKVACFVELQLSYIC